MSLKNFILKNNTTIMTGLAVTGVVSSVIMAIDCGSKCNELINKEEQRLKRKINKKEQIQLCWKYMIPTGIMSASTIGCIIYSANVSNKKTAAVASLYSASQKTNDMMMNEIKKKLSPDEIKAMKKKVYSKQATNVPICNENFPDGDLIYDVMSDRYFRSTKNEIDAIVNNINKNVLQDMFVPLNDFHDMLGLDVLPNGNDVGWTVDNFLEVDYTAIISEQNTAAIVIDYMTYKDDAH